MNQQIVFGKILAASLFITTILSAALIIPFGVNSVAYANHLPPERSIKAPDRSDPEAGSKTGPGWTGVGCDQPGACYLPTPTFQVFTQSSDLTADVTRDLLHGGASPLKLHFYVNGIEKATADIGCLSDSSNAPECEQYPYHVENINLGPVTPGQHNDVYVTADILNDRPFSTSQEFYLYFFSSVGLPTANAGPDQTVEEGSTATLDGTGSTGAIANYEWKQISGSPSVTLNGANTATATFDVPDVDSETDLTFELTVTDNKGATDTDQTVVKVTPAGDFSLVCDRIPKLHPGSDASAHCGIQSIGGFDKPVSLSCTAPPISKLTCNMQPNSVTPPANGDIGTDLSIAVPAASNTPIGDFTLQVSGTSSAAGGGTPITHTADVKVSVVCADPQVTHYTQTSSPWTLKANSLKQAIDVINKRGSAGELQFDAQSTVIKSHDIQGNVACVDVNVTLNIVHPNWPNANKALKCQPQKDEWDDFLDALLIHENGHNQLATTGQFEKWSNSNAGFDRAPQQMIGKQDEVAIKQLNAISSSTQAIFDEYDAPPPTGTDHGETQGAILNDISCPKGK